MSPMLKRTWLNSLAQFLIVNLQGVLKLYLGLDLIDPRSSYYYSHHSPGAGQPRRQPRCAGQSHRVRALSDWELRGSVNLEN